MSKPEAQGASPISQMSATEKRAALARLLQNKVAKKAVYPLTFGQLAMWFQQNLETDNSAYNMPLAFCLHGELEDPDVVARCLQVVVDRHSVLRSVFQIENDEPVQRVSEQLTVTVPLRDIGPQLEDDWQAQVLRLSYEQAHQAFDLATGPLFRFELLRLSDTLHVLLSTFHHIVFDGWSVGVLLQDFSEAFIALVDGHQPKLKPLPASYRDYVLQQRQNLSPEVMAQQVAYWKKRLKNIPAALELPTDYQRPPVQTFKGTIHALPISPQLTRRLTAVGQHIGATFFMTALASFYVLLGRLSGQTDIVLGVSTANRDEERFRGLLGLFSDVLPMRAEFAHDPSFIDFLASVKRNCLADYDHAQISLTSLIEALNPVRDPARNMLFQAGFDYQNTPWPEMVADLISLINGDTGSAKLDLNLSLSRERDQMIAIFEYNTDLFSAATIEQFARCYQQLLESIARDPGVPLSKLALIDKAQRQRMVHEWNQRSEPVPKVASVLQLIEAQARQQPTATALRGAAETLSYEQLDQRANVLAQALLERGLKTGSAVGVLLPRCFDLYAAVLAIWKAGGCYVPFDPATPAPRIAYIAADSELQLIITQSHLQPLLSAGEIEAEALVVDESSLPQSAAAPDVALSRDALAYMIYTSGTTGHPKGVMIDHGALLHYACAAANEFAMGPGDRMLQFASLSFDASAEEIFPSLISGSCLVLRDDAMLGSVQSFFDRCSDAGITTLDLPTAYWHEVVDSLVHDPELQLPPSLRLIIIGGEAALPAKVAAWQSRIGSQVQLLNTYGPTEATVTVSGVDLAQLPVHPKAVVTPIGRPNANTRIYVVDKHGQPTPPCVYGELLVGGATVGVGYHKLPLLTTEKFIDDYFTGQPGARLYRTGDIARYTPAGVLEFRGRRDGQVKVRGFRIELDEIEAALRRHADVAQAAALVRPDPQSHEPMLVAYVVAADGAALGDGAGLQRWMADYYPAYMVPAVIQVLAAMPLTVSSKFDRQALAALPLTAPESQPAMAPPRTPEEQILADIWADVLGLESIGIHDNFFQRGGHSLLMTKMLSRVRRTLEVEVPLARVFEAPTIAQFAHEIEQQRRAASAANIPPIERQPRRDGAAEQVFRQSYAQQRLWFLDQLNPGTTAYNNPIAVTLRGPLQPALLEQAWQQLIDRHEILRTRFQYRDDQPVQIILAQQPLPLTQIDLRQVDEAECRRQIRQHIIDDARQPFDLVNGPLLRMQLLRSDEEEYVLVLNWHHIITDAWSMGVFIAELGALYQSLAQGNGDSLDELPLQYADYAEWEAEWLSSELMQTQLQYWQQQLANAPQALALPVDRQRRGPPGEGGAVHRSRLDQATVARLKTLAHSANATLFMTVLAVFKALLARYSGQQDIIVGTPISGRRQQALEPLIGLFVNTLPLRTRLDDRPNTRQLIDRVRDTALAGYAHQDLPFDRLVEGLRLERDTSVSPLFRVMFVLENQAEADFELPGLEVEVLDPVAQTAKFDLTLGMEEQADGAELLWEYATDIFDAATIERLALHFEQLLRAMLAEPQRPIDELPLLTASERRLLLQDYNQTAHDYPPVTALHHFFEQQAAAHGDAAAVICDGQTLSYAQLNQRANQLAHYLLAQSLPAAAMIGLCLPRNSDLVVALLGALKAGAAYVPLDASYPPARLEYMARNAGLDLIISDTRLSEQLPDCGAPLLCLDRLPQKLHDYPDHNPADSVSSAEQRAYVIYTSGSTGQPKGVEILHRSAVAMLHWAGRAFSAAELRRVLASTSLNFDLSVFEIFAPLSHGGAVVLVDNALTLVEQSQDVSLINTVPSAARVLLDNQALPATLQTVNLAGEALPVELVNGLLTATGVSRVCNLYGPSEDTTYSSWASFKQPLDGAMIIGRPIDNTRFYVLDEQRQLALPGAVGELYIGGAGLAAGYINQPELTAERFIDNPLDDTPDQRLYRTGDLVRWDDAGHLRFIGRLDDQVKIRGFRIELSEIERCLTAQPEVAQAVVVTTTGEDHDGASRIVAFYTLAGSARQSATAESLQPQLQRALRQHLPEYMLPTALVGLDEMPLTANGKIDKQALPLPQLTTLQGEYQAPTSALEQQLCELWADLLRLDSANISITTSFFQLGGHSLLLIRMLNAIADDCGVQLQLRDLFEATDIQSLALLIELEQKQQGGANDDGTGDDTDIAAIEDLEW
ncbi:MAG: hypothetical protein Tsb002_30770 [Wenzhouxiangellaceae bacterium]